MSVNSEKIEIFSTDIDKVVEAHVAIGRTSYEFALNNIQPLIDQLEIQRRIQNPRFYDRLERDIIRGCLMPPITIAFIKENPEELDNRKKFEEYINQEISKGFVLDGIQRLSTLKRAFEDKVDKFPKDQSLFVNVLVCKSMDSLLYRMITLNNGQKPMTTRHQIEILTTNLFEFPDSEIKLIKEKDNKRLKKSSMFNMSDFVLAYMAFLSNSINIDSQKLIQEKLDELLASKILEQDPSKTSIDFEKVIALVLKLSSISEIDKWFRVNNNLIGFCSEIKNSFDFINEMTPEEFKRAIANLEEAFKAFNVSKIKLGRARRSAVSYFFKKFDELHTLPVTEITNELLNVLE